MRRDKAMLGAARQGKGLCSPPARRLRFNDNFPCASHARKIFVDRDKRDLYMTTVCTFRSNEFCSLLDSSVSYSIGGQQDICC